MTEARNRLRLEGLEADNLLAFLALLGLLRTLETTQSDWRPRAAWDLGMAPLRPVLVLADPQTEQTVCEAAAKGVAELSGTYHFPKTPADDSAQDSLSYSAETARALLEQSAEACDHRKMDLWGALLSDAAHKDGKIEATPLCLLFGQGHQYFLDRLTAVPRMEAPPPRGRGKKAVMLTAAETLREALFRPWERQDPTPSFRWDPAEDVRYALRADDPSGEKSTTQHGANRLAALGLAALTVTPVQRGERVRLQVVGGVSHRGGFDFFWPVWNAPASLAAIRAMLTHPSLPKGPEALAHLGVAEVRRAHRISVGKFMNFMRAEPVHADR